MIVVIILLFVQEELESNGSFKVASNLTLHSLGRCATYSFGLHWYYFSITSVCTCLVFILRSGDLFKCTNKKSYFYRVGYHSSSTYRPRHAKVPYTLECKVLGENRFSVAAKNDAGDVIKEDIGLSPSSPAYVPVLCVIVCKCAWLSCCVFNFCTWWMDMVQRGG